MAIVHVSGFETGDLGEWDLVDGPCEVVDTIKKTGDYAMRCNTVGAKAKVEKNLFMPCGSFYLYIATAPGSTTNLMRTEDSSDAQLIGLRPDRKLQCYSVQVGSTVLDLDTWYRISWTWSPGGTFTVYINGNFEVSSISFLGSAATETDLGSAAATTTDLYFDDFVGDGAKGTSDVGDIRILRASPNAAGQYAEFDTISGYGNCDEVPASDVDFVDDSGVSALHRECYNLQDSVTIGLGGSDIIKAVNVLARLYDTGNTAQGIIVRDNSTDYLTMLSAGKAYTWKNKLYDTNAPRGIAWSQAIFDALQSGGYSEGSKDVYMSCVMVMVAFTPVVGVPENTVYLVKATGRRTQLATGAVAIRIDPTTGRRSLDTSLTKFLVREDDGTLRAKSA